jgi:hypothetical protein
MQDYKQISALHEIVAEMVGRENCNVLALATSPIDVDPPSQHSSKKAFLLELKSIQKSRKHADGLLMELLGGKDEKEAAKAMREDVGRCMDELALKSLKLEILDNPHQLLVATAKQAGFHYSIMYMLISAITILDQRLNELNDQEKEFWAVTNRPPNYHARIVALRLARLYAKRLGAYPTFGTARDGGHPSTDFAKALEKVFSIIGISANIRGPAEWAIKQLTEADVKPDPIGLMGSLLGAPTLPDNGKAKTSGLLDMFSGKLPKEK